MKFIRHRNDLQCISVENPTYPILDELCKRLIDNYSDYNPDADGWIILAESETNDFDRPLYEIWPEPAGADITLMGLEYLWEGVSLEDGFYHAIYLANNQFGLYFLIPDCPELPDNVRASLENHIDPS